MDGRLDVEMEAPPAAHGPPPLALGLAITGLVMFGIVSWIALGGYALHLSSVFAAFLLLWYWASVEKADFRRLPRDLLGALVGLGLIWALRSLTSALGIVGLILGALLIAAAILVEIMRWVPIALNPCAMLFLTVAGIPPIMKGANFLEVAGSLLIGTAYLSLVVWVAKKLAPKRRPAPSVAASADPASGP